MARAFGWSEGTKQIAPFYIDLQTPVPENGIPKPGPLQVHLKDDHMQYAITWLTLAVALLIAFAVWVRTQRKA
jgi:cytochrome oxidase assembly protein ShyY1